MRSRVDALLKVALVLGNAGIKQRERLAKTLVGDADDGDMSVRGHAREDVVYKDSLDSVSAGYIMGVDLLLR